MLKAQQEAYSKSFWGRLMRYSRRIAFLSFSRNVALVSGRRQENIDKVKEDKQYNLYYPVLLLFAYWSLRHRPHLQLVILLIFLFLLLLVLKLFLLRLLFLQITSPSKEGAPRPPYLVVRAPAPDQFFSPPVLVSSPGRGLYGNARHTPFDTLEDCRAKCIDLGVGTNYF